MSDAGLSEAISTRSVRCIHREHQMNRRYRARSCGSSPSTERSPLVHHLHRLVLPEHVSDMSMCRKQNTSLLLPRPRPLPSICTNDVKNFPSALLPLTWFTLQRPPRKKS